MNKLEFVFVGAILSSALVLFLPGFSTDAHAEDGCLKCHKNPELNKTLVDKSRNLVLDMKALGQSVHADVDCTDCHTQFSEGDPSKPHKKKVGPPRCDGCHEEAAKAYAGSVHGRALANGEKGMALCGDCHGAHDIVKVTDSRSRVFKLKLPITCARCHKNTELAEEHGFKAPKAASQYMESIHGRRLLQDGLLYAPSCTDCHGSHDIQRDSDPRSPIHHSRVPQTCAKCHKIVDQIYHESAHGKLLAHKDPRGAVCIDCHSAHQIIPPSRGQFKLESDERCGKCHQERLKRYRETYHGKAMALGQTRVAACYDCHGYHNVLPASDSRSSLSKKNLVGTCRKCHPKATEGFTGYMAHGDHTDKKNYPRLWWTYILMTALLLGVFGFFGVHTIMWFVRTLVTMLHDPKAFREAKRRDREQDNARMYVRFRPIDRFCHILIIISFLLLVLTGMPLKFYYTGWARWMFSWMGGAEVAAALHRLGALITAFYFILHLASLLGPAWRNRSKYHDDAGHFRFRRFFGFIFGPDSLMPNWQDVKDFWAHQKWFFGRGPHPQFDRWTYWEKFDYLAVFWGVAVIGLSGLVMWIPETTTRYLPGWIINVAHVIHSDEALLAAGFIFTFHFFNVHFRPEKFPMDSVIFSGRITEAEMIHERRRLYDRLKTNGGLEAEKVRDEWPRWRQIFIPFGMLAFLVGVVLVVAIYWAMAKLLFFS